MDGKTPPVLKTKVPGPKSVELSGRLAKHESPTLPSRAIWAVPPNSPELDPPVWQEALGSNVLDVDGNILVDLTAGFGVSAAGHRHPKIVKAGQKQLGMLPHAMADVYPSKGRIELVETLAHLTGMPRFIVGSSGAGAVEAALKTACYKTGKPGILAFEGSYHGLSYGALTVTDYKADTFRKPFEKQLGKHVVHAEFGGEIPDLTQFGAVIVEPIQGRGGIRVAPDGWLKALREKATAANALLIFDEIFTGFGRTGSWFAFLHEKVQPDLICLGKGMTGGFPIAVCGGTEEAMTPWGITDGEAVHCQTFQGNPVGCAMAVAAINVINEENLVERSKIEGEWLRTQLLNVYGVVGVRGRGLMTGAIFASREHTLAASRGMLGKGFIILPSGKDGKTLSFTPPLNIQRVQLEAALQALDEVMKAL